MTNRNFKKIILSDAITYVLSLFRLRLSVFRFVWVSCYKCYSFVFLYNLNKDFIFERHPEGVFFSSLYFIVVSDGVRGALIVHGQPWVC